MAQIQDCSYYLDNLTANLAIIRQPDILPPSRWYDALEQTMLYIPMVFQRNCDGPLDQVAALDYADSIIPILFDIDREFVNHRNYHSMSVVVLVMRRGGRANYLTITSDLERCLTIMDAYQRSLSINGGRKYSKRRPKKTRRKTRRIKRKRKRNRTKSLLFKNPM